MFFSLTKKIIYLILTLSITSAILFIHAFYSAYSTKIEKDQMVSIQRNQQYNNLLLRNIGLIKELKSLANSNHSIAIDKKHYNNIYALIHDNKNNQFLIKEQQAINERISQFEEQYETIKNGVNIIAFSTFLQIIFIIFMGLLIKILILNPINKISHLSEQVSRGNLNLRLPKRRSNTLFDELDRLSITFNSMLDNLQNMMEKIRDNENFLQSIVDGIPDGIRVIDKDFNIIIANKSYYNLTEDFPKSGLKCYYSAFGLNEPCHYSNTQCPVVNILHKNNKKTFNAIHQFINSGNKYLSITSAPLFHNSQNNYVIEAIHDLSQEIDFSHQQKISSMGFLSSSIAHEIKNQIGALRLIVEHLIDKYFQHKSDTDEDKKLLNLIHSEIINASQIPERLLKLTRISDNSFQNFNCVNAIKEIIELLDYEAKINGIVIDYQFSKKEIFLFGNETDFKIAAINIILNAIKAMSSNGILKIKISTSKQNEIKISFTDNGIGINKENLQQIFNPFFSLGHQKEKNTGTGLGLSITKSLIEKQGGSIDVKSQEGKGSCFTFTFSAIKNLQKSKQPIIKNKNNSSKKDNYK